MIFLSHEQVVPAAVSRAELASAALTDGMVARRRGVGPRWAWPLQDLPSTLVEPTPAGNPAPMR
jgi:hypothetical protein